LSDAAERASGSRVALVHDWLTGMRGGEKVLTQIARLFPAAPIFTLFHFRGSVSREIESHPITASYLQGYPGVRKNYRRWLPAFPAAIEDFDLTPYDLVISSSHCVAKGVVPRPGAFHLCYCHTPMRYAWDQEHAYFPRRTGLVARVRSLILSRLRNWDVASSGRVDLFVANSNFVAQRIERYYRRQAEVLHPPVDTDRFTPAAKPRERFCLMVSALSPYKRIDLAVAACERANVELRIVGAGPEKERLSELAGPRTRWLGRVDESTLEDLYQRAHCFLQPGIEDFGISTVEALACGCPVVALGQGGVLDIVDDGVHGVLYPSSDSAEAVAAAIDKSLTIRFNELTLRRRAEDFSTAKFETGLRELITQQLNGWNLT
jgi:glycosyltransferase involved in cell wall biosynthesis